MIKQLVISLVAVSLLTSCGEEERPKEITWTKEQSTDLHRELAKEEEVDIKLFLAGKGGWKVTKTGSGLRYYIYETGRGAEAKDGDIAEIEYKITLLDGTFCYGTEDDEVEEFVVDHSEIESGIQEGIKYMHEGDKAHLIIPSHLAHGLIGDMNKIPPLTPLVVDIHLRKIL